MPPISSRVDRVVGPAVTLTAIGVLTVIARFYEALPVKAPACGLRTLTGIPCLACGGTRCMMALSHGQLLTAIKFNPLVILSILAAVVWFLVELIRFFEKRNPPRRRARRSPGAPGPR